MIFFDTFPLVKTCGQHPGRMSRVGGHFYVFSFFHVSEHSEHICVFFFLFLVEKLIIFMDHFPFPENSAKINDFIVEPFPSLTLRTYSYTFETEIFAILLFYFANFFYLAQPATSGFVY